jgi:hypothetical protein
MFLEERKKKTIFFSLPSCVYYSFCTPADIQPLLMLLENEPVKKEILFQARQMAQEYCQQRTIVDFRITSKS